MANCLTNGIVLINDYPHRLQILSSLSRGSGRIAIHGLVDSSIEEPIAAGIAAAERVSDFLERPCAELQAHDISVAITIPSSPDSPLLGKSFHLGLAVNLMLLLSRVPAPNDSVFTGGIDDEGNVIMVEGAAAKRKGSALLGFQRIFLPTGNFDFFERSINQVPLRNIYESWGVLLNA